MKLLLGLMLSSLALYVPVSLSDCNDIYAGGVLVNSSHKSEDGFYGVDFSKGMEILNDDGSVYSVFNTDKNTHEFYYMKGGKREIPSIRAYFPDYHIFILDAIKVGDDDYEVKVDGQWRKIHGIANLNYKTWSDFLVDDAGFVPLEGVPLVMYSLMDGGEKKVLGMNENYSFSIEKVSGDWVYAVCDKDCEGCGESGIVFGGWFKWKENNKLLIDLRYIC